MEVTVRRRRGQGACDFVNVNRIFNVIQQHDDWRSGLDEGSIPPAWLTPAAKVAIFVLVYLLSGCDFLPAIYNIPFKRMLAFSGRALYFAYSSPGREGKVDWECRRRRQVARCLLLSATP